MNKIMTVAVVAMLLLAGFPAGATEYAAVSFVQANDVQLGQYPIEKGRLSATRQAALGLRPYALQADGLFFNHQADGRFALKLTKKDTIVLVDRDGVPRYEESCGNRLIDPKLTPPVKKETIEVPVRTWTGSTPVAATLKGGQETSTAESLRTWVKSLPEPARLAAHGLGWLAALGLLVAAAVLILWGLYALVGSARHSVNVNNWRRPTHLG